MNTLLPIFINLDSKRCVVIGGGAVAYRKALLLMDSKAEITIVSKRLAESFDRLKSNPSITIIQKGYTTDDIKGAFLVFTCTDDPVVNQRVFEDCKERNILINVADSPENCNFTMPAIVSRNDLKIAVSTNNKSCSFTKRVRMEIEKQFDNRYASALIYLGKLRSYLKKTEPDIKKRQGLIEKISFSDRLFQVVEGLTDVELENLDEQKELKKWLSV